MSNTATQGYVDSLERYSGPDRHNAQRVQALICHIEEAPTAEAAVQTFLQHRTWCRSEELFRRYSEVMQALRTAYAASGQIDAEVTHGGEDLRAFKEMSMWTTVYTVLPDAAFEWTTSWDDALNWGLATRAPYVRKGSVEKGAILAIKGYENPLIFVEPWHIKNQEYDLTSLDAARRRPDRIVHSERAWWKLLGR